MEKLLNGKTFKQIEKSGTALPDFELPALWLKFGFEIEGMSNLHTTYMMGRINKIGLKKPIGWFDYDQSTRKFDTWAFTHDGSIDLQDKFKHRIELCSPVFEGEDDLTEVEQMLNVLRSEKVMTADGVMRINKSCALHVHVDKQSILDKYGLTSEEFYKRVYNTYSYFQDSIDSMLAPSRRNKGNYCVRLGNLDSFVRGAKHHVIRLTPNTLEFRQHQATMSFEKLIMWLYMCQRLIEVACEIGHMLDEGIRDKNHYFRSQLLRNPILLEYYNRRVLEFSKEKKKSKVVL
jgi:hypothetical protein